MVTYSCPMCDAKLRNENEYKCHVHGSTSGRGRFTPPSCPVGKQKFYGAKKEAPEMTNASAHPLDLAQKSTLIDKIRGCRQPIEPEEPSVKLLSDAEIDKLTDAKDYAKQVTTELRKLKEAKVRKRVITEVSDSQVYIRYTPGQRRIYIGSSKVEYARGGRKREHQHDGAAKRLKRSSDEMANLVDEKQVVILKDLSEKNARQGEFALYWSLHPDRKSNDPKKSPPQYLPDIYDDNTGEWRRATHAEMREMWCPLLADKLRELGLLDDPKDKEEDLNDSNEERAFDTSNEQDGSGDESEPAPAKKMRL